MLTTAASRTPVLTMSDVEADSVRRSLPVHVMHVVHALQPGGMEFGVVKLVNGLDRGRVQSSICSTVPAVGSMKSLVSPDVPVFELGRRPGTDPKLVLDLYRLFRRERPDVVHTHAWGTLIEGLAAARLARVPQVVHGEHGTLQLRGYQRWIQRRAWSAADKVLAVSTRLAERMAAETGFPLPRIHTIRNGVDLTRFGRMSRAVARDRLSLPPGALVIGALGRLVPVKNHAALIEAARLLRDEGADTTVIIAGEGPLRGELEGLAASAGLADRVTFLGHRTDPEVVLAALDVFVLPSISEGLPNTVLEAMATGLPSVVSRVGGADELIEPGVTGVLVAPGDPAALARALGTLIRDEGLRRVMGTAARLRTESEFTLAGMIRRYEGLYTSAEGPSRRYAGRPGSPTGHPRGDR
jgi:sugar transferase (PEP-CTERM/EpsH1 system associated)